MEKNWAMDILKSLNGIGLLWKENVLTREHRLVSKKSYARNGLSLLELVTIRVP